MFSSEFNLKRSLLSLVTADYAVVKDDRQRFCTF